MQKEFGKVKFFNKEKWFGFIIVDESNEEIFFHIKWTVGYDHDKGAPTYEPKENDRVQFEVEEGKKWLNAVNVEPEVAKAE